MFNAPVPALKAEEIKKMLSTVLDFEQRSATQSFFESLPPEMQQAVREKRVIVGMNRDEVLLAVGKPVRKVRDVKDGDETEDWIYGTAPGKITFVTFREGKVIKVRENYAGLGSEAAPLPPPR
jgi:ketosteroid isomerase-like protein